MRIFKILIFIGSGLFDVGTGNITRIILIYKKQVSNRYIMVTDMLWSMIQRRHTCT